MSKLKIKYQNIQSYPDIWKVRTDKMGEDDFVVRVCAGVKKAVAHPEYNYKVSLAIPLQQPTRTGIVSIPESKLLQEIEMSIETLEDDSTRMVGVLTGRNMREYVLYTSKPVIVEKKIIDLKKNIKSHELQYDIQQDPNWGIYKFLLGR